MKGTMPIQYLFKKEIIILIVMKKKCKTAFVLSMFQTCQIEADGSYYGIGYHYQNHFITNYADSGFKVNATGVGLKYIHVTGSKWK